MVSLNIETWKDELSVFKSEDLDKDFELFLFYESVDIPIIRIGNNYKLEKITDIDPEYDSGEYYRIIKK